MYMGNQAFASTSYTPNNILLETRYYWRIDEVISYPTLLKGDLWTFTSSPIYYVDDFQTFTNTAQLKNAWKATGTANNSYIYQTVEGTDKSVRFWYDSLTSPYSSGIKRSVPVFRLCVRRHVYTEQAAAYAPHGLPRAPQHVVDD